ncbi:UNVERIFIED_CONTAM: hypothetical protein HDU68_001040 [Siphonaria sp. JEL0065]|nr:hypothetical protein HDU68_001040 [Siphonaria sp. JEL0065]
MSMLEPFTVDPANRPALVDFLMGRILGDYGVDGVDRTNMMLKQGPQKPSQSDARQAPTESTVAQVRFVAEAAMVHERVLHLSSHSMCPLLMVVISAVLGSFINRLITQSAPSEEILYCTNNYSLNAAGWPSFKTNDKTIYNYTAFNGKEVNYYRYIFFGNLNIMSGPPGASILQFNHPCVGWFGDSYPQNSPIYERNANLTGVAKMDSTFIPPPDQGWVAQFGNLSTDPKNFDLTAFRWFSQFQQANWAVVGARPGLESALGSLPDRGKLTPLQVVRLNASVYLTPNFNASTGILGSVSQRIFANFTTNVNNTPTVTVASASASASGTATSTPTPVIPPYLLQDFQLYPYFERNSTIQSPEDIDQVLSDKLLQIIADLAKLDKNVLLVGGSTAAVQKFQLLAQSYTDEMPYGGLFLDAFDADSGLVRFILYYGSDIRVSASSNFPSPGFRLLENVALLNQAALRAVSANNQTLAKGTVTQGFRIFPERRSTAIVLPIGGYIGRILYPFGVSFLLPIFVIMLVKEKEDRIYIMMKMNGVKPWAYYISHYITFFILYVSSTTIFLAVGILTKLDMFKRTSLPLLVVFFFLWGNVQIALAFLMSAFFSKSRIALVMTFLVVLVGVVVSLVLGNIYSNFVQLPILNIWPPFAFYRGLNLMNNASYSPTVPPFKWGELIGDTEFRSLCRFLFVEIFVYGGLALYCNAVVPTEFGVALPWHFPVSSPLKAWQKANRKKGNGGVDPNSEHHIAIAATEELDEREDDDVRDERARVDSGKIASNPTIVVSHMKKVYPSRKGLGPKVAVRNVTFAEETGVIFGLLGPNGAGKTTLISILTGLYDSSGGSARLAGFDIKTDIDQVYNSIGVCPQFDILWDDLTVAEHLYFYARLKGVAGRDEADAVEKSLQQVSLEALRYRLSKTLSGGEKRRLSIAIALVGNPAVVFLDEPTTGLDPEVRRLIWNIIQGARDNKTIILTTHSMEEAETLCQRIGIMAKGSLRCIAPPLRLKELYGKGFKLAFHSLAEDTERACAFVETVLPIGWKKVDAFSTNTAYEFPASSANAMPDLFEIMEKEKLANGIAEWSISQTTLEEVFVHLISDDDSNAD